MGKTARLAIVVVPALIILLFLGTWQLQRLGWKQELIATMEDRLVEQPVALPSGTLDLNEWAFRPVEISGRFIDATPFIFPARTLDGAVGNDIVAPFLRDDDGTVLLVHRGWVANGASFDPAPEEAVVTGVVRAPWTNTLFRP
ncbi:MAG: SURF1 family protein, partial [Pseudomonadota bacterium]